MEDANKRIGTWRNLRNVALETKPRRFLAYCSYSDSRYYELMVHVAMQQAVEGRKFYLWSAFDPHEFADHPTIEHLTNHFKMYNRQINFDQTTPLLVYERSTTWGDDGSL